MAEFVGALLILGLITTALIKSFAKWNDSVPGVLTANGLCLFVATVLAGFGRARDTPVFGEAFTAYVLPQLVILGITLWRWNAAQPVAAPPLVPPHPPGLAEPQPASWSKGIAYGVAAILALFAIGFLSLH